MVALTDGDRRALTADVLRITKARRALASAALSEQWPFALIQAESPAWVGSRLWDTNEAATGIRIALQRALLASAEQGRGLAELARSNFEYTVARATRIARVRRLPVSRATERPRSSSRERPESFRRYVSAHDQ